MLGKISTLLLFLEVIRAGHWDKCLQKHHFHDQSMCQSGYDDCIAEALDESSCASGFTAIWDLCCLKGAEGCSYSCVPDEKLKLVTNPPPSADEIKKMARDITTTMVTGELQRMGFMIQTSFIMINVIYGIMFIIGLLYIKRKIKERKQLSQDYGAFLQKAEMPSKELATMQLQATNPIIAARAEIHHDMLKVNEKEEGEARIDKLLSKSITNQTLVLGAKDQNITNDDIEAQVRLVSFVSSDNINSPGRKEPKVFSNINYERQALVNASQEVHRTPKMHKNHFESCMTSQQPLIVEMTDKLEQSEHVSTQKGMNNPLAAQMISTSIMQEDSKNKDEFLNITPRQIQLRCSTLRSIEQEDISQGGKRSPSLQGVVMDKMSIREESKPDILPNMSIKQQPASKDELHKDIHIENQQEEIAQIQTKIVEMDLHDSFKDILAVSVNKGSRYVRNIMPIDQRMSDSSNSRQKMISPTRGNDLQFQTLDARFGLNIIDQRGFNTFRDSMFSDTFEPAKQGALHQKRDSTPRPGDGGSKNISRQSTRKSRNQTTPNQRMYRHQLSEIGLSDHKAIPELLQQEIDYRDQAQQHSRDLNQKHDKLSRFISDSENRKYSTVMNFNRDKQPQEESKQSQQSRQVSRAVTIDNKYNGLSKLYLQKLFNRGKNSSLRSSKKESPPKDKFANTPSISDLNSTKFKRNKQQAPHEIVSLQAKSIHNQGQRFYCEEQNVTVNSKVDEEPLDDDILIQGKSNKRRFMNREIAVLPQNLSNRPSTQEGGANSYYYKKKRNISNNRTQENTNSNDITNENTTSIEGLEKQFHQILALDNQGRISTPQTLKSKR